MTKIRRYFKKYKSKKFLLFKKTLKRSGDIFVSAKAKKLRSPLYVAGIVLVIFIFLSASLYFIIQNNEDFAANFADNNLRPLLGENRTISLEAMFFNLQDNMNQLKYHISQSATPQMVLAQITSNNTISGQVNEGSLPGFSLDPIPSLILSPALAGEGVWTPLVSSPSGVLIAKTVYRPDPTHPYALVDLIKMNMDLLRIRAVAGTTQPGGPKNPGPGIIPSDIQASNNLVSAFNGGFQQKDGYYGMIVGDKTYLPLVSGTATLIIPITGKPSIVQYSGKIPQGNIEAIRQNGPMLIQDSKIVTSEADWNMQTWGLTTTNSMYTWRSGLGVTDNGDLVYAGGPALVPQTLARALLAAGAVNAMQLDINPVWVRYVLFKPLGDGQYDSTAVDSSMVNGGYQYLHDDQKDFFYLYK